MIWWHHIASSLNDVLEIGDTAKIHGPTSDRGEDLNDRYVKLTCLDQSTGQCVVELLDGTVLAIKGDSLEMGMKADEMSCEDEKPPLGLSPTPDHIEKLPCTERMELL